MQYRLVKGYQDDSRLRASFDQLAVETFGLSFENWYANGFWAEKYIPYSIVLKDEVVANVSVNIMDFTMEGQKKRYLQLGTVMTRPACRNQGYIKILMDAIKTDYTACRGAFLWANDSVLDFYPKFGFRKCREYHWQSAVATRQEATAQLVRMNGQADWQHFLTEKNRRRSNGYIQLDTDGLLMFYLSQFMRENVYYIEELAAYVVAEIEDDRLILHDVYSFVPLDLNKVIGAFGRVIRKVILAFTPVDPTGFIRYEHRESDSTFFIRGTELAEDMRAIQAFPDLAHA